MIQENDRIICGPQKDITDTFLCQFIHATLTLSACNYSDRRVNYHRLMCHLFSNSKHPRFYIAKAMNLLHTKGDDVLPFLQHFIGCCNEKYIVDMKKGMNKMKYKHKVNNNLSYETHRKQMVLFRNSLLVMNHFKMV